jgi:hypothetical protein
MLVNRKIDLFAVASARQCRERFVVKLDVGLCRTILRGADSPTAMKRLAGLIEIVAPARRRERLRHPMRWRALASGLSLTLAVAIVWLCALFGTSPAQAQVVCTTDASGNVTCTNPGTNTGGITTTTTSGNVTNTNSGSNTGGITTMTTSGNVTNTNSGSNTGGIATMTTSGNVTNTNSGSNTGGIDTLTSSGNITNTNSGTNTGGINTSVSGTGNVTVTNSGSADGISTAVNTGNVTVTNSGSNTGISTIAGGNVTVINSGSNTGGISTIASGNVTVTNSGCNTGRISASASGKAIVINSGTTDGISIGAGGDTTLTNIVGGRVLGHISMTSGTANIINFQGGNWLFTILTEGPTATINAGGAPFVVSGNTVAVLGATTFALADRSLMFHRRHRRNAARSLR